MDRETRINEALTFLRENAADKSTAIELLKDEGYAGDDIMEALGRLATSES